MSMYLTCPLILKYLLLWIKNKKRPLATQKIGGDGSTYILTKFSPNANTLQQGHSLWEAILILYSELIPKCVLL